MNLDQSLMLILGILEVKERGNNSINNDNETLELLSKPESNNYLIIVEFFSMVSIDRFLPIL